MILDTTYFLPLIGIGIDKDLLKAIDEGKVKIHFTDIKLSLISIFELQAKAAKNNLNPSRVSRGINAIIKTFDIIPFHLEEIVKVANELRRKIVDYIDCVIIATAVNYGGELVTEDNYIISKKNYLKEKYNLKIYTYEELIKRERKQ